MTSCNTIEVLLKIIKIGLIKLIKSKLFMLQDQRVSRYDLRIRKLGTREKKKAKVFYTKDNKHME